MMELAHGSLVAVGQRSIDAVPHEVQRQLGPQRLLVQRKTKSGQHSHNSGAADNDRRTEEVDE